MSASAQWPTIIGALVTTILYVLAVAGILWRVKKLEKTLESIQSIARTDRDHAAQGKHQLDDLHVKAAELLKEINFVHNIAKEIRSDVARLNTQNSTPRDIPRPPQSRPYAPPVRRPIEPEPIDDFYEPPRIVEDGAVRLKSVANQIVQQSSITLDAFRTNIGSLAGSATAWPAAGEGMPLAFIVEHHGIHYVVPNVVKPARLPDTWFNRSDFGVNDEIRHIDSLPLLIRSGDKFEVAKAGVFGK